MTTNDENNNNGSKNPTPALRRSQRNRRIRRPFEPKNVFEVLKSRIKLKTVDGDFEKANISPGPRTVISSERKSRRIADRKRKKAQSPVETPQASEQPSSQGQSAPEQSRSDDESNGSVRIWTEEDQGPSAPGQPSSQRQPTPEQPSSQGQLTPEQHHSDDESNGSVRNWTEEDQGQSAPEPPHGDDEPNGSIPNWTEEDPGNTNHEERQQAEAHVLTGGSKRVLPRPELWPDHSLPDTRGWARELNSFPPPYADRLYRDEVGQNWRAQWNVQLQWWFWMREPWTAPRSDEEIRDDLERHRQRVREFLGE